MQFDKLNYTIFAISKLGSDKDDIDGVVSGHAYSIISIFEV